MNPEHEETEVDPENTEPVGLRRSARNRRIGGVAGGVGERFDIDANFVRVAFVVLTLLWGLGAAIYLAMWALVPLSGTAYALDSNEVPTPKRLGLRRAVLLLAAIFVGLIFVSVAIRAAAVGRGLSVVWLIFLAALAVVSLRRPVHRLSLTRLVAGLFISLLSVVILGAGAVLGYVAFAGVPFSGGLGQSVYRPVSFAQVHHTYRMAVGSMTIDLRGVSFSTHVVTITSTVGIGVLNVDVPPGVRVDLTAVSGNSNVNYPLGQRDFYITTGGGHDQGALRLDVKVGIGNVNLFRAPPGQWLPMQ